MKYYFFFFETQIKELRWALYCEPCEEEHVINIIVHQNLTTKYLQRPPLRPDYDRTRGVTWQREEGLHYDRTRNVSKASITTAREMWHDNVSRVSITTAREVWHDNVSREDMPHYGWLQARSISLVFKICTVLGSDARCNYCDWSKDTERAKPVRHGHVEHAYRWFITLLEISRVLDRTLIQHRRTNVSISTVT